MITRHTRKAVLLGCVAALALSACSTERAARDEIATTSMQTSVAKEAYKNQEGPTGPGNVRVRQTVWLGDEATRSGTGMPLPAVVEALDAITISSTEPMSLIEIARRASAISGIEIVGVNQLGLNRPGSPDLSDGNEDPRNIQAVIDYTGPMSGLLDMVANKFGVSWEYRGGVVRIYDFDTRTFTLIAAPIATSSQNEIKSTINAEGGSENTENQSTTSNGTTTTAKLDYWARVEKDVAGLLPDGTAWSFSPESGSITVTARPQILDRVEKYVKDQNAKMGRQVAVSVTVLSVDLSKNEGLSANLDAVFEDASTGIGASLNAIAPGISTATTSLLGTLDKTKFAGSELLIQAIAKRTDTSLVTSGSVTTMNNQPAPIQISQEQSYVSGYTSTTAGDATTIVTPELDSITTGFSMGVLPRILPNGKVALNYSIGMSSSNGFTPKGEAPYQVEAPSINSRGFQQNVMLRSGDTLILAGYEQVTNKVGNDKRDILSWVIGGDRTADQKHERLIILITPVVIEDPASLAKFN